MPYQTAGIAVLGALTLLNLLLTYGVIRRLREHTRLLAGIGSAAPMLAPGSTVGDFAATTLDGELVSRDALSGQTLVGFFSPGCPACTERLPDFVARAATPAHGRARTLAVIAGGDESYAAQREQLAAVARVVVEPERSGPVGRAFGVSAYPVFALVDPAGEVLASGYTLDSIPAPVAA